MNNVGKHPVLLLLPYVSCSGLELFGLRFVRDLINRGIPAAVASPRGGLIAEQCLARGVPHLHLPVLGRWDPRAMYHFCQFFDQYSPRLAVGFRTQTAYPFHLARILKRNHTPFMLFYRIGAGNQPRRDPLHRKLFQHVAAVVPNADHVKNKILLKWAIAPEKVVCIKSGIDTNKYKPSSDKARAFRAKLGIPSDAIVIGNTGRIHPEKGSQILLETLFGSGGPAQLREDVYLVYVGREHFAGYADQLNARAFELGHAQHFFVLPFRNDIESVYPAFDVYALAVTSHETYAYTALEAMASGVIPIVPKIGGMKEMYVHGEQGFFFEHRNQNSLREQLQHVLSLDSSARAGIGAAARRKIEQHASWDSMMESYLTLMERHGVSIYS